jgi:streptomycin 6-kinase
MAAMLKIASISEEARGSRQLAWWDGHGAAPVLEIEGDAVLVERAQGDRSLVDMVRDGRDDEATRILCRVAAELHAVRSGLPEFLVPLELWFRPLTAASALHGSQVERAAAIARRLLDTGVDIVSLHGDLHHSNVLDFGDAWRAIDPKGLVGERAFDFVHMLRNPEPLVALAHDRLERQVGLIAGAQGLEPQRLLEWTAAFSALSALWLDDDGDSPAADLTLLSRALALVDSGQSPSRN